MEYLYHYTNLINMKDILKSGALKLTPSNLKKPKDLHRGINQFGKHALISETDSYKPVVWLTNSASSQQHGLELPMPSIPPEYDKKRIRFVLEKKLYISDKLTILHGQSDHLSRRFRSLISERDSRRSKSFL